MAEPVYPSLEEETPKPIGFEGLTDEEPTTRQKVDDKRVAAKKEGSEEIRLLTSDERSGKSVSWVMRFDLGCASSCNKFNM